MNNLERSTGFIRIQSAFFLRFRFLKAANRIFMNLFIADTIFEREDMSQNMIIHFDDLRRRFNVKISCITIKQKIIINVSTFLISAFNRTIINR